MLFLCGQKSLKIIVQLHNLDRVCSWSALPDWTIFESSWQQIHLQK